MIPVRNYLTSAKFKVNQIMFQRISNFKLVISNNGLLTLLFSSEDFTGDFEVRAEYFNTAIDV